MFSLTNNPMHLDQNETVLWAPQPQSIAPLRVAFITTGATASASELVPNALEPYLAPPGGAPNIALVGAKTYGKPVGQRGFTMQACGTVVYLVSLKIVNSEDEGGYYQGLPDAAGAFAGPLCQAPDDLTHDTWESAEASTAAALSWLATGTCPAPAVAKLSGRAAALALGAPEEDVYPEATEPDLAQRHVRGLF